MATIALQIVCDVIVRTTNEDLCLRNRKKLRRLLPKKKTPGRQSKLFQKRWLQTRRFQKRRFQIRRFQKRRFQKRFQKRFQEIGGGSCGGGFGGSGGDGGFGGSSGFGGGGGFGGADGESGGGFGGNKSGSGCRKCGKEGHFARECPEAGAGGGSSDGCRRCHATDHMVKDCPQPMKCFNCQGEGHQSKDCPNPKSASEDGKKPASNYVPEEKTVEELAGECDRILTGINFDKYDKIDVQVSNKKHNPIDSFAEAGFTETVLRNVNNNRWTKPTPVQRHAIPIVLGGEDLMACAQTGSGKTGAYILPVLTRMIRDGDLSTEFCESQEPNCIILSPTRELAIQIYEESRLLTKDTVVKTCIAYGGTSVKHQADKLRQGCNILVATPGRLKMFVEEGRVGLKKVKFFILDEADRMLDMGFEPDVRQIVEQFNMPPKDTSDREQQQREQALHDFKKGRCPVLVATSVAARGLDIKGVDHVINYDLPKIADDYVHRIGRSGRIGNPGRATSFYDDSTDGALARDLVKILGDAQQIVPEWLSGAAGGGYVGGGGTSSFMNNGTSSTGNEVNAFASHDSWE